MSLLAINVMGMAVVIGALLVAAVVVVVIVLKNRKGVPQAPIAPAAQPQPVPPPVPAPSLTAAPAPEPAPAPKPATLQVEALSPAGTDMTPMLADPEPELGLSGTDEMPKFATSEMPALQDAELGPATYRTPGANELAKAIRDGTCPKCGADTFVGSEDTQDDGTASLTGRCGACGHRAQLIDMRVG